MQGGHVCSEILWCQWRHGDLKRVRHVLLCGQAIVLSKCLQTIAMCPTASVSKRCFIQLSVSEIIVTIAGGFEEARHWCNTEPAVVHELSARCANLAGTNLQLTLKSAKTLASPI